MHAEERVGPRPDAGSSRGSHRGELMASSNNNARDGTKPACSRRRSPDPARNSNGDDGGPWRERREWGRRWSSPPAKQDDGRTGDLRWRLQGLGTAAPRRRKQRLQASWKEYGQATGDEARVGIGRRDPPLVRCEESERRERWERGIGLRGSSSSERCMCDGGGRERGEWDREEKGSAWGSLGLTGTGGGP